MNLANADQAYFDGRRDERLDARIEAFGAIRRAATIARRNDLDAESWEGFSVEDELRGIACAASVRQAIRVAIGSDKV